MWKSVVAAVEEDGLVETEGPWQSRLHLGCPMVWGLSAGAGCGEVAGCCVGPAVDLYWRRVGGWCLSALVWWGFALGCASGPGSRGDIGRVYGAAGLALCDGHSQVAARPRIQVSAAAACSSRRLRRCRRSQEVPTVRGVPAWCVGRFGHWLRAMGALSCHSAALNGRRCCVTRGRGLKGQPGD